MTTDTVKKEAAVTFPLGGAICTLGGMAKGSGMIAPNMATMLCFLTTDAAVEAELLKAALGEVVKDTFNMMSVDCLLYTSHELKFFRVASGSRHSLI